MSRKRKEKWRIPTIRELLALTDYTKSRPASIDSEINSGNYWSSTTYASFTSSAWFVDFYYGTTGYQNKAVTNFVRCVRNTKNGLEWSKAMNKQMTWYEAFEYVNDMNKETV